MPAQALDRGDSAAMVVQEPLRSRERLLPGDLRKHLPLARAAHVELVEEGGHRGVVAGEERKALERIVPALRDVLRLRPRLGHFRITPRAASGFTHPKVLRLEA
jgi:hypothetical protein